MIFFLTLITSFFAVTARERMLHRSQGIGIFMKDTDTNNNHHQPNTSTAWVCAHAHALPHKYWR